MARKVTSSRDRAGRTPAKPPVVTTSKGRGNRSSVSQARVTNGGTTGAGGARVTNAAQRTSTGSARVTGANQSALPPGQRGGQVTTRGGAMTPPRSGGAPVRPVSVRDLGPNKPNQMGGGSTRSLPPGQGSGATPARPPGGTPRLPGGGRAPIGMGGLRGGLLYAAGSAAVDYLGLEAGKAIGTAIRKASEPKATGTSSGRTGRGGTTNDVGGRPSRPASNYENLYDPRGGRGNYGLDKTPPASKLPAPVTRASSGSRSSGGGSSRSTSRSSAPARSSTPTAPAKPGQKWDDFNPNRGTSKTNNPLMKDMVGRMKDREDKAQASSASKLTSKFNTNSNFSGEKMDGSMYQDSFKKKKKS